MENLPYFWWCISFISMHTLFPGEHLLLSPAPPHLSATLNQRSNYLVAFFIILLYQSYVNSNCRILPEENCEAAHNREMQRINKLMEVHSKRDCQEMQSKFNLLCRKSLGLWQLKSGRACHWNDIWCWVVLKHFHRITELPRLEGII